VDRSLDRSLRRGPRELLGCEPSIVALPTWALLLAGLTASMGYPHDAAAGVTFAFSEGSPSPWGTNQRQPTLLAGIRPVMIPRQVS
jgi:hypothetical protein